MASKVSTKKKPAKSITKLFVLDTNVLLHDPSSVLKFREHDVYIPFVTIEELDNKKVGTQDINRNARAAIRLLDEISSGEHGDTIKGFPLIHHNGGHATGTLYFQDLSLPFLPNEHIHKNDNLYLSVLKHLESLNPNSQVIMVTKDLNLRIKAKAMGFLAQDYMHDHVVEDADMLSSNILALDDESFLEDENVQSWKSGKSVYYKIKNKNWTVNQFLHITPTGKMYQIIEVDDAGFATLEPVLDYKEPKKAVFGITARNVEQQAALALLLDPEIDFVALLGPAGTGKTLLTLAAGLAQIEEKLFDEIIFTRATIPVGEDIGFLPGTEEEKMAPWAGAIFDNLEVLTEVDDGPQDKMRQLDLIKNKVKIKAMSFMRGRSLPKKYVIIDEAQNLTPKQMKTLVTRAGDGTKIICMGNLAQIDSPYISEASSGLTYSVEKFKGWQHFGSLILTKGERSRLANEANARL